MKVLTTLAGLKASTSDYGDYPLPAADTQSQIINWRVRESNGGNVGALISETSPAR